MDVQSIRLYSTFQVYLPPNTDLVIPSRKLFLISRGTKHEKKKKKKERKKKKLSSQSKDYHLKCQDLRLSYCIR